MKFLQRIDLPRATIEIYSDESMAHANETARLLRVAHELFAVCKELFSDLDECYDVDEESGTGVKTEYPYAGAGRHLSMLRNVIAKAEGR